MSIETYGHYQLLKRLAMGGMAQIYLARQRGPEGHEKRVVVKRILPHLAEDENFVRMFLDEARIAARLNHPNIVQIFDLGAQDDSFFIAMEYIHGEDLRRVWKRAERSGQLIPVPLVCRIIIEACAGLDYAHKKVDASGKPLGIVHRDISPQNILLTFEGRVKVVDFGIAKAADKATVTRSGVLKGKYSYMSPEQAAGDEVDCRSDIFALGVVLYELLTGVRLFKRPNDMDMLRAVAECAIAPPSQLNSRVPGDLDAIVMKALTRRPEDRYAEAVRFQLALEDWLLAHHLPSSTAHVAAYMKDLYAARLAEEARVGDVLVDESESLSPAGGKASKKSTAVTMAAPLPVDTGVAEVSRESTEPLERAPMRTPPRGSRGTSERKSLESRRSPAARPSRVRQQVDPSPSEAATEKLPRVSPPRSNRGAVGAVAAGVLVGLGLGSWWALRQPVPERSASVQPLAPPEHGGTLRFAVTPSAEVSCGGRNLGSTPLPDVRLPPGVYECKFSNPELGTRSQQVEVKPNTHTRVVVKF